MANNGVKAGYWLCHSQLPPSDVKASLFTHLFCGHAGLNSETYEVTILPSKKVLIDQFSTIVKESFSKVKTLLSIGGDDAKADRFAAMAATSEHRASFIESSIAVARAGKFDGLDLQWLHPHADQRDNLEALLNEWHSAIVKEAKDFHRTQLLLVSTVFFAPDCWTYPIETIQKTLDWVNVVSYDFYTPTSSKSRTGLSSAFYKSDMNPWNRWSGAIDTWIRCGLPAEKIVFGIPFHGWAWKLENPKEHDMFSPADGPAQGPNISNDGLMEFLNIKKLICDDDHVTKFDTDSLVAYTYFGTTWITYDDENSIISKILAAKNSFDLLGYFVWNIAGDDEFNSLATAASAAWG